MSKYGPTEGYRYDGIYKVVKYWPQRGEHGFIVWKYLMRRDDSVSVLHGLNSMYPTHDTGLILPTHQSPAPWTSEGKKMTKTLRLTMQVTILL